MEVEAVILYENQPLKKDVESFMQANDFINILDTVNDVSGDQLYANKNFFSDKQLTSLAVARKRKRKLGKLKSFLRLN